jgi:hypothetical protein
MSNPARSPKNPKPEEIPARARLSMALLMPLHTIAPTATINNALKHKAAHLGIIHH